MAQYYAVKSDSHDAIANFNQHINSINRINLIICIIRVFSPPLRLGEFSSCFFDDFFHIAFDYTTSL